MGLDLQCSLTAWDTSPLVGNFRRSSRSSLISTRSSGPSISFQALSSARSSVRASRVISDSDISNKCMRFLSGVLTVLYTYADQQPPFATVP